MKIRGTEQYLPVSESAIPVINNAGNRKGNFRHPIRVIGHHKLVYGIIC